MKSWIIAGGCALALAAAAQAGSLSDPVVDPGLIVEEASGSSSGTTMVALLALLMAIPVVSD